MNFTKEEIKWINQTRNLQIGNTLDELNTRTREYLGFQGRTVEQAQEQALIDFQRYIKSGEYIATTEKTDHDHFVYFKAAQ